MKLLINYTEDNLLLQRISLLSRRCLHEDRIMKGDEINKYRVMKGDELNEGFLWFIGNGFEKANHKYNNS